MTELTITQADASGITRGQVFEEGGDGSTSSLSGVA